ncbi:MAG: TrkH family potassium uptake protein [Gammaproteobacteria bacterium]|nr:TrkH family potassium uptake protein [Gammaproteobacteria bacterium]
MNYGIIRNLVGKIMILVGALMLLPVLVCLIYQESLRNYLSFLIPSFASVVIGVLLNIKKADPKIQTKEGFIIVALSWIIISLIGAIPLYTTKYYPSFIDSFFEIVSGFTTTGASVVSSDALNLMNIEGHSVLFWRSFSHWIGGMGVLVFILAIIPEAQEGSSVHILRAESPGVEVGRLVSRMKASTRILYLIYLGLSLLEFIFLSLGPNKEMNIFDSLVYTFGTAGTGGFAINSISIEYYGSYYQYVIASFMLLFGVNFSIYYLLLMRKFKEAFSNEELRWYFSFFIVAVSLIVINIYHITSSFEEAFRLAFFQVASIMTTTGFSTVNFDLWPSLSKTILLILMVFGSCAGSTAGGIKTSRVAISLKATLNKIKGMINPRRVEVIKFNNEPVKEETVSSIYLFIMVYFLIMATGAILISVDGYDMTTNFSASVACISNIGPGLSIVGPYGSYSMFSTFSKLVLSFEMLAGRLELFPILILFHPRTWRRM